MSGKAQNLLIVMVDEMSALAVGCYGNPIVKTPNIDRLAAWGVRFADAYSTSPICIPARAAFATGRYPHQTGYWDNVFACDGQVKGWAHRLQAAEVHTLSIGKLHYVDGSIDSGLDEQIMAMHLFGGGDVYGLEREDPPARPQSATLAAEVQAGDSGYTRYDKDIAAATVDWLHARAGAGDAAPFALFASFMAPHFPLTVPQDHVDLYDPADIVLPDKPR